MKVTLIVVLALIMLHSASSREKYKARKCNGQYHCEQNRASAETSTSKRTSRSARTSTSSQKAPCISIDKNLLCDGTNHCPLGDDEMNCTCTALPNPTNGKVFHDGFNPGAVLNYTCDIGFELSVNTARTCQIDLSWDGSQPSCIIIECPTLSNISNGIVTVTTNRVLGVATYSCSPGYLLYEANTRVCGEQGVWSGVEPVCKSTDCPLLHAPQNGQVTYDGLRPGNGANYKCDVGFVLSFEETRTCEFGGSWSGTSPTCSAIECPTLSNISNGIVTVTTNRVLGVATYSCSPDYLLNGASTRVCREQGWWSGDEPVCKSPDCPLLPAPQNGQVIHEGLNLGNVTNYKCDIGFVLSMDIQQTCEIGGSWSGTSPTCSAIECAPLDDITFGSVSVTTNRVLGVATYSCITGHTLEGSCERVCLENGSWTGTQSICLPTGCPELENPLNGFVSINELNANYSCKSDFAIMGADERICLESGMWTGNAPLCIEVPSSIAYGTTFITGFMTNLGVPELSIFLASPEEVTVTIESPYPGAGNPVTFIGIYKHTFPDGLMHTDTIGPENKGVFISSTKPIAVFSSNYMKVSASAHLVYPVTDISTNYFVSTFPSKSNFPTLEEEFIVIGTVNSTIVTISIPSQTQMSFNLNRLQSYQYQGTGLSGTHIEASENVVVISGHECARVPNVSVNSCDHIENQMVPTDRLKKAFIVSPLLPRPSFTVQLISPMDATGVTIYNSSGSQVETITMNRGESQIRTFIDGDSISIIATSGIIVSQYNNGQTINSPWIGDPSSTNVPGIIQYDNNYMFSTINQISTHFVSIIMHTAYDLNDLKLDGISQIGNPTLITVPEWGTYNVMSFPVSAGYHILAHTNENARFGAILYGYQKSVAYSLLVGIRL